MLNRESEACFRREVLLIIKRILAEFRHNIRYLFGAPSYGPKVFCIGYNKTGTTTVGKSLERLGYKHSSFNKRVWRKFYRAGDTNSILRYTAKFDSFDDIPWLKEDMIPILDKAFAGSKFIYLERDEVSWKQSYLRWNLYMYGSSPDVETAWEGYKRHRDFVLRYFNERPSDQFIALDISDPVGFKKLANFLGKNAPQDAFPHYNKTPGFL